MREAAEEWVRKPTDEHRRAAMKQAETAGFGSAGSVGCRRRLLERRYSMAPAGGPESAATAAFHRSRRGRLGRLAAARGPAVRRDGRLVRFLASAKDIAAGGAGRIEAEPD